MTVDDGHGTTAVATPSPVLQQPGAVEGTGPEAGVAAHYGDPFREQRALEAGRGVVDLSHRGVLSITGADRLSWLHSLTTQDLTGLPPGGSSTALVLSPHGHIEHVLYLVDTGVTTWIHTEPGRAGALAAFLHSMQFMLRVEVSDRSDEVAVLWWADPRAVGAGLSLATRVAADTLGGTETFVPREQLLEAVGDTVPAGHWAYDARRIAAFVPRLGFETDHRSIPNELGWLDTAVHLDKGCYRGQETVARVHTLGRPPRRLVFLHLDGSTDDLPEHASAVRLADREVGYLGSSVRHAELGPIALAVVRRNVDPAADLLVEGRHGPVAAAQEIVVSPEVGLHVRPRLR